MELLDFYERIRQCTNIINIISRFVTIKMKGREALGLCPFHKEKTPSFTISAEKKFFHCFGCEAHGDVIEFYAKYFSMKYHDAALKLAQEYRVELPRLNTTEKSMTSYHKKNTLDIENLIKFFQLQLNEQTISYLIKRGLDKQNISDFEIGFIPNEQIIQKFITQNNIDISDLKKIGLISSKNNFLFHKRIIFPIKNLHNEVVGFGGRSVEPKPKFAKYLNSPETDFFKKREIIYGEHIALKESYKEGFFILVEGYLDVIILHQLGFKSTGAILGTSFSEQHIQKIFKYTQELIICFDNDAPGAKAIERLIWIILPHIRPEKKISFITLPKNSDPGDLLKFKNKKIFNFLMKKRSPLSEVIWNIEFEKENISTAEDKAFLEFRLKKYCNLMKNKITKNNFEYFFRSKFWQLVKNSKFSSKTSVINTSQLISQISNIKQYTEIELTESIIISLVFFYPQILQNSKSFDKFQEIKFTTNDFNDFQLFICEQFSHINDLDFKKLSDSIENTRFKALGMVLLDLGSEECSVLFSQICFENSEMFFDFFIKKRYFLLLCDEYSKIIQDNTKEFLDKKIPHYIEEIHKLNREIHAFNEDIF